MIYDLFRIRLVNKYMFSDLIRLRRLAINQMKGTHETVPVMNINEMLIYLTLGQA
jgi:hypothetical protein